MSVYTVHEPPLRAANAAADPDRFQFVRDGFYFWAFLLTPLWMAWHRMWLVLVLYVVMDAGLENAMYYSGLGTALIVLVQLLISLLVGTEASTLRRFSLARRGWRNAGVVSGETLEAAERRFFDSWVRTAPDRRAARAAVAAAPAPAPPMAPSSDIIGLFPDPGANR